MNVGLSGVLVSFSDMLEEGANRAALAFRAALDARALDGITETTTSLTATFIAFDPHQLPRATLHQAVQDLLSSTNWTQADLPTGRTRWHVPAVFGGAEYGPQLDEAAALAGVTPQHAVAQICADPLRVMTIGFSPGVPYLGSLPEHWDIPRQTGLTKEMPAGGIAVAIRQLVLFSTPSPTGWRQVARCGFAGFKQDASQPFTLTPGDEIKLNPVDAATFETLIKADKAGFGGATSEPIL